MQVNFIELTEQLKVARQENDFNELHIKQFREKFKQLEEQLNKSSNISIQYDSSSFIDRISITTSSGQYFENLVDKEKLNK